MCSLSIAEKTSTPGHPTTTPNVNEEMKKKIAEITKPVDVVGGISDAFNSIKDGISNTFGGIKTFFEDGVGGVIEKSLGDILESFVNATAIDGKWVFSTPTLVEFDWVKNIWWIMFFISIGSIGIGMGVTMLRILTGKYKGNLRTTLFSFLLSSVMLMFSLFIADKMILFGNDLINSFSRNALTAEAQKPENQSSQLLLGEIDYSKMGFHYFDGKSLVNLSFGVKLTDLDKDEGHMYDQFLSKNGGGGALILIWAMLVIGFIGIFGTLRQFVIGLINGLGPIWISIAAWTGNMKPIYGYLNLNIRCIALSFVFDLTWLICTYISNHSTDFAVGRQLGATLLYTIALVVSCYLFGYWIYQAFKSPIDLAGGLVQEKAIKMFTRAYPAVGAAAKILGAAQEIPTNSEEGSSGDDDSPKGSKPSDGSGGPKVEIKDRLAPAEQVVKPPIPTNEGNQEADIKVKPYNPNNNLNNMRYDSTLGRPVKSNSLSVTDYDYYLNGNNQMSSEEKTQSYQRTSALKDQMESYNKSPQSIGNPLINKVDSPNNTDDTKKINTTVNSSQVRDALKQANIKPSRNSDSGRLLESIENKKKDGEKS